MSENEKITFWSRMWQRTKKRWLLGLPIGAFIALIIGAVGFYSGQQVLHFTSTDYFCMTCHAQHSLRSEELVSPHGSNAMGIVVTCSECHIPREGLGYLKKKVLSLAHVYESISVDGFYDQKWLDDNRMQLAEKTRKYFRSIDSSTCMACHVNVYENQPKKMKHLAKKMHTRNFEKEPYLQKTCIDCHTGVSHYYPKQKKNFVKEQ